MADLATVTPLPPVEVRAPRLHFGRLREAAMARMHYGADIPSGTALKTILAPDYWAHYANTLKPQDLIEAFWEDGSQEADLRVMFVGRAEARVALRSHTVYDKTSEADVQSDDYEVKWKGPGAKFAVVRRDTGAIIKDHLYPKSEAVSYLRENLVRMRQ